MMHMILIHRDANELRDWKAAYYQPLDRPVRIYLQIHFSNLPWDSQFSFKPRVTSYWFSLINE